MQFTEQLAIDTITKFNLTSGTIRTWRTRGKIPDKYNADSIPQKLTKENDLQQAQNIIRACNTGKFNVSALCRLADVNLQHLKDVIDEKYSFNSQSLLALKKAINTIRNDAKKIFSLCGSRNVIPEQAIKEITKFMGRSELKWSAILPEQTVYDKFFAFKNNKRSFFPADEINTLKSALLVFLTETTL